MATVDQLRQIMPRLSAARAQEFEPWLNQAMSRFDIDSVLRQAAFLAQVAHESGEFQWMHEIWGPTNAQRRYEPPSTLASSLGNTQAGDGHRFMGRGPIQITGRSNYTRANRDLGLAGTANDVLHNPDILATPQYGCLVAGLFWDWHDLNTPADAGNFRKITQTINGGLNGFPERVAYYERALAVLGRAAGPSVTVVLEGEDVSAEVHPYLAAGRVMVALAPMAAKLHYRIIDTSGGNAVLRAPDGHQVTIPLVIHDDHGYVALASLPLHVQWDAAHQRATAEI